MNLLYITNCYAPPNDPNVGAASRHYYTIEKLLNESYTVDCITADSSTISSVSCELESVSTSNSENFTIYNISSKKMKNSTFFSRLLYYMSFFWSGINKIRNLNKKYDYVIASVPSIFIGYLGLFQKYRAHTKLILDVRDLWTESLIGTKYGNNKILVSISRIMESFLYKKADLIVCTTISQAEIVRDMTNNMVKVDVVMNGFDLELITDNNPSSYELPNIMKEIYSQYQHIILFTGKHSEYTDLFNLLNAASFLDDKYAFLLVGGGYLKESLMKEVESKNMKNVFFHDPVSKKEILKYMYYAHGLIINYSDSSSWSKVVPNKLFDYLYWDKLIIAAVCDGEITKILKEASSDNIVLEAENPKLLADKINSITKFEAHGNQNYLMEHLLRNVQLNKLITLMREI